MRKFFNGVILPLLFLAAGLLFGAALFGCDENRVNSVSIFPKPRFQQIEQVDVSFGKGYYIKDTEYGICYFAVYAGNQNGMLTAVDCDKLKKPKD